jgi:hypothetical protein
VKVTFSTISIVGFLDGFISLQILFIVVITYATTYTATPTESMFNISLCQDRKYNNLELSMLVHLIPLFIE